MPMKRSEALKLLSGMMVFSLLQLIKQPDQAMVHLELVQRHGKVPNLITYTALISACEKGKQTEQALEIFEAMKQHGVVHNHLQCLDQCLRKGQAARASPEALRGNEAARHDASRNHL